MLRMEPPTGRLGVDFNAIGRLPSDVLRDTAGVVHDLGNLIQIAASAVNLIARGAGGRDEAVEPLIARARASLERAGALVHQTMGRASAPSSAAEGGVQPLSLAASLAEITELLAWACEPNIMLSIAAPLSLPWVRCNRLDLQNAVLNLVINARDALPVGGVVRVVARPAAENHDGDAVDLQIIDNGVGMDAQTRLQAFTPLFTTKAEGHGSGMGLAMVKRFVEAAGGRVSIASRPNAGTTVTIRLPTAAEPIAAFWA
jgi:signal transduction histidine kinase